MKLELAVVPTPNELTQTMKECSMFTVASSPPEQAEIKFFIFAQHVRGLLPLCNKVVVTLVDSAGIELPFFPC